MTEQTCAIPEPRLIERLPRAPLLKQNKGFVPGETVKHQHTFLSHAEAAEKRKKLLCICCLHPFEGEPFRIPLHFDDQLQQFTVGDAACSPSCAMQHVLSERRFSAHLILPLITQFAHDVFHLEGPFAPAPPRSLLASGEMTLEEYRSGVDGAGRPNLMNHKPWMIVLQGTTTVSHALSMRPVGGGRGGNDTADRTVLAHRNASVAALASAGVFYSEASGEVLPQPEDICSAIVTTIKDRANVHDDRTENAMGLIPCGEAVPRRALGMTVLRAPRTRKECPTTDGAALKKRRTQGLDSFLMSD